MTYRYAPREDHADLASGAVLRTRPGQPAFPVRLARELFGRARSHLPTTDPVSLWDPCCGSAQLLVTLGLTGRGALRRIVGSDVDPDALELARANARLLTLQGLEQRRDELDAAADGQGRPAYRDAAAAAARLVDALRRDGGDLPTEIHRSDILAEAEAGELVARTDPDIVLADLPYGDLSDWQVPDADVPPVQRLGEILGRVLAPDCVVVLVARSRRAPLPPGTRALERLRVGHRAAAITYARWLA